MKKQGLILILIISTLSIVAFSCKKPKETKAMVTVKLQSDTNKVVPYAHIRLEKYDINVEGQCRADGTFSHVFKKESILDVHAWTEDPATKEILMLGKTSIRLVEGKEVRKSVFIK